MKTIEKTLAMTLGMLLLATAQSAEAGHQDPAHWLKISYQQQRDALLESFQSQREAVECAKRDALAELRVARAYATKLCEPQRKMVMRQLKARRREIMIRYRADLVSVRSDYEIQSKRLQLAYENQRQQLAWTPVCTTQWSFLTGPVMTTPGVPTPAFPTAGIPTPGIPTPGIPTPGIPTPGIPTLAVPPGEPTPAAPPHDYYHTPSQHGQQHWELPDSEVIVPEAIAPDLPADIPGA